MIRQQGSSRLEAVASRYWKREREATCRSMLGDLLAGKGFMPIEPAAVIGSHFPVSPYNQDIPAAERQAIEGAVLAGLGAAVAADLQRCSQKVPPGSFTGFDPGVGAPPYRIYLLPGRVNPFPASPLVYWSDYLQAAATGREGYVWVNLERCEATHAIPSFADATQLVADPAGQASALTVWGDMVVAWEASRGLPFRAVAALGHPDSAPGVDLICTWNLPQAGGR